MDYVSSPAILHTQATLEREARLREILTELELSQVHLNILKLQNSWQPYHNWAHCVIVALNVVEAYNWALLSRNDQRLLVLAALYHDFNHTGSPKQADVFNIVRAIAGMREWVKLKEKWVTQEDLNQIAEMIYATEARHHHEAKELKERILMDADILATDVPDALDWYAALSQETGMKITLASSWTFIRVTEARSSWGMRRREDYLRRMEAQLDPHELRAIRAQQ